MNAYVFPGQGAQFPGMAKELYESNPEVKSLIDQSNDILGFDIKTTMFEGSEEDLKQTKVTQPAIFIHSVSAALTIKDFNPDCVAGHSLGEFSALVASKALTFQDGLKLVYQRAMAMQKACEEQSSTMAAVLGLDDDIVERVCEEIDGVVVAANYNCPGQLVISGEVEAVKSACEKLKEEGAKRALVLPVGGAFHSPLMASAKEELEAAIENTTFNDPICPIYQNVDGMKYSNVSKIKQNLILQLTSPVRWTQIVQNMVADGVTHITECGPGKVLQGLVKKVDRNLETQGFS